MMEEFLEAKAKLRKRTMELAKEVREMNKEYGEIFHKKHGEKLLNMSGVKAYQVVLSNNPECCVCSELRINVKVTDKYREEHGEMKDKTREDGQFLYFSFGRTELHSRLENKFGEDFALEHIWGDDFWVENPEKSMLDDLLFEEGTHAN